MVMTTFLRDDEIATQLDDPEIAPLLAQLAALGESWVVQRRSTRVSPPRQWWQCPVRAQERVEHRYCLYWPVQGSEYEVINFWLPDTDTNINPWVPKEVLLAYLYGSLGHRVRE